MSGWDMWLYRLLYWGCITMCLWRYVVLLLVSCAVCLMKLLTRSRSRRRMIKLFSNTVCRVDLSVALPMLILCSVEPASPMVRCHSTPR